MKKLVLAALLFSNLSIGMVSTKTVPTRKNRISNFYQKTHNKLKNHKGKVCFAAGAIGATIINKAFSYEIQNYVKPFIKSICKKTYNFFKRIFKGNDNAGV